MIYRTVPAPLYGSGSGLSKKGDVVALREVVALGDVVAHW